MAKNKNNANKSNAKNKANPDTQGMGEREHMSQGVYQDHPGSSK